MKRKSKDLKKTPNNKAFKFRLEPNKEQETYFAKAFGHTRFLYNKMLIDKIDFYDLTTEMLYTTPTWYKNKYPFLKEIDSLALANTQLQLNTAYGNFFRGNGKVGFPKFKTKKGENSYTTNNQNGTISLNEKYVKLPVIGWVRVKQHRQIPKDHIIKSATINRTSTGKHYISILTEFEFIPPQLELDKNKAIGLDYASNGFYVDNQGKEAEYPQFFRKTQAKLAQEQRKLSLMTKGSNNYKKQKLKVAKIHEKIANSRKDWLHKLSTRLVKNYDFIFVEDINLRAMSQCLKLGKSTMDNGFGMFREMLSYKAIWQGKIFDKIDKWFPSSKACSECSLINEKLSLGDRVWTCECGATHNRDHNAAINICREGLLGVT